MVFGCSNGWGNFVLRNLVSDLQKKKLLDFLESDPLLAFDYDGTLAPIVTDAGRADLRPKTRRLLKTLCGLYPCALMTGRGRDDVLRHVKGIGFVQVLGNHGAEWGDPELGLDPEVVSRMIRRVDEWRAFLAPELGGMQGVLLEDKRLSLTVHYRRARRKKHTLERIQRLVGSLRDVRTIGGKQVLNVLPSELGGKGESLRELKKIYRKNTALFAGDDLNDEEVFVLPETEQVFKIRVGQSYSSKAEFFLPDQERMDWLLETLIRVARVKRNVVLERVGASHARTAAARA
jgi:trehalose 6-phosphate phosphatase